MTRTNNKISFMEKMATFIVDKRNGIFLAFLVAAVFCAFSSSWVKVNEDITTYLPETTETRQGLTIMEEEFVTYGMAEVMIDNVTFLQAQQIADEISQIPGIKEVVFEDNNEHYKGAAALFNITFSGGETDDISIEAMNQMKEMLVSYDTYISSEVGAGLAALIQSEMNIVMVVVMVIILCVLLFTSHTYMEIPVLLITFGMAALLNMGTNFLFGEISFVSNSIGVVLQLALAIDYAIILCHRYMEERTHLAPREAVIIALSKAVPEISSSSLTTISGMVALMFMQFGLGFDLGIVLIKAILFSLLSVFTLMPGLLMLFSSWIDKSHHKNFVPNITSWGKLSVKTRYIIPPIFMILLIASFLISNNCTFVYGYTTLSTIKKNESQIAEKKIEETFGKNNLLVIMVPNGNYKQEEKLIQELEKLEYVDSAMGLANIEAMAGYVLTDALIPRQFAELTDLDIEEAKLLYSAYAAKKESYGEIISGIDQYRVPLIDMFGFLYEQKEQGYITLDDEMNDEIEEINTQLNDAKLQLQGQDYSRMLLNTSLPEEGEETFVALDELHAIIQKYYPQDTYIVGDSTSDNDLGTSFIRDNAVINILSALFVTVILLFTFQSAGLPILLMMIIEGSIWMNFSVPVLTHTNMFFMSYLIVSSIQMGANIDYAIVITNRYQELKKKMPQKEAIVETLNQVFPTIITSGSILAAAGLLIGVLSSEEAISSIGICLGRGTIISIILVMGVLPQLLILGDFIIEKTAFTISLPNRLQMEKRYLELDGHVKGYVSGRVDAQIQGILEGTIIPVTEPQRSEGAERSQEEKEEAKDEKA